MMYLTQPQQLTKTAPERGFVVSTQHLKYFYLFVVFLCDSCIVLFMQ
jgi:hypothetical protein